MNDFPEKPNEAQLVVLVLRSEALWKEVSELEDEIRWTRDEAEKIDEYLSKCGI